MSILDRMGTLISQLNKAMKESYYTFVEIMESLGWW
jgi:hypothetical protein